MADVGQEQRGEVEEGGVEGVCEVFCNTICQLARRENEKRSKGKTYEVVTRQLQARRHRRQS